MNNTPSNPKYRLGVPPADPFPPLPPVSARGTPIPLRQRILSWSLVSLSLLGILLLIGIALWSFNRVKRTTQDLNQRLDAIATSQNEIASQIADLSVKEVADQPAPAPAVGPVSDQSTLKDISIQIPADSLNAGERVELTAELHDQDGLLFIDPMLVTFATDHGLFITDAQPKGAPRVQVWSEGGIARVEYVAVETEGTATITVTADGVQPASCSIDILPSTEQFTVEITVEPGSIQASLEQTATLSISVTNPSSELVSGVSITLRAEPEGLVSFDPSKLTSGTEPVTTTLRVVQEVSEETSVQILVELPEPHKPGKTEIILTVPLLLYKLASEAHLFALGTDPSQLDGSNAVVLNMPLDTLVLTTSNLPDDPNALVRVIVYIWIKENVLNQETQSIQIPDVPDDFKAYFGDIPSRERDFGSRAGEYIVMSVEHDPDFAAWYLVGLEGLVQSEHLSP